MKSRGHLKIDLFNLYSKTSHVEWNAFLALCQDRLDLGTLEKTLVGVQLGMSDLAKKNLNNEKMNIWFIRIQRSLENTIKSVIKLKRPNPLDNPLNAPSHIHLIAEKRKRDQEIELFLKRIRY